MIYWDELIINIISYGTLIANIFILSYLLWFIYGLFVGKKFQNIHQILGSNSFLVVFLISLSGMIGSLIFSELLNFPPCFLCWVQRALLYPLVFVSAYALIKKGRGDKLNFVILFFAILGAIIAGYQYYTQMTDSKEIIPCSVLGLSESCSTFFFLEFGYITIPLMSLTSFLIIIIFSIEKFYLRKRAIA